jgi:hypothetical protein
MWKKCRKDRPPPYRTCIFKYSLKRFDWSEPLIKYAIGHIGYENLSDEVINKDCELPYSFYQDYDEWMLVED